MPLGPAHLYPHLQSQLHSAAQLRHSPKGCNCEGARLASPLSYPLGWLTCACTIRASTTSCHALGASLPNYCNWQGGEGMAYFLQTHHLMAGRASFLPLFSSGIAHPYSLGDRSPAPLCQGHHYCAAQERCRAHSSECCLYQ